MVKTHKRKRKEAIAKQQAMEAAARARAQSRIIKPKVRASWGWVFVCVCALLGLLVCRVGAGGHVCVCVRERGVEGLRRPIHYLAAAPLAGQPPMLLSTPHSSLLECCSLLRSPSPSAPAPTTSWSAPAAWRPACPTAPRSSARWVRCACFGPKQRGFLAARQAQVGHLQPKAQTKLSCSKPDLLYTCPFPLSAAEHAVPGQHRQHAQRAVPG